MSQFSVVWRAALCALATSVSFAGCATEDAEEPAAEWHACDAIAKDHPDREMLQAIDAMGLCGSSAVDVGDAYLVEGDIHIGKSTLTDKQARTSTLVSTANIRTLTVRVHTDIPSDGGVDDWRGAVQSAIADWNAVPNNLVRLQVITTGAADITFMSDLGDLGDQTAADAEFPLNGEAGNIVQVNLDFDGDVALTESQKRFLAVHEIGHCIGLRHTNWAALGESAIHINGTASTDAASVMNGETAGDSFVGLSSNDSLALRLLYPEIVTLNLEYAGCSNGVPRLPATWGGTLVQPVIEWQLERYVGTTWSQVYRGTGQEWTFNVPSGTSLKARVRGRSNEGWSVYKSMSKLAPSCGTPVP